MLTDIVEGVRDAQKQGHAREGEVNPLLPTQQGVLQEKGRLVSRRGQLVQVVKFDVAVTAEAGKGTKGGIDVFVGSVGLGSQGESKSSQSTFGRIQFEMPVTLPYREDET